MRLFQITGCTLLSVWLPWMAAVLAPNTAMAEQRFDLEETYPISAEGTIALTTRDADVTIIGSDRDDVHVEIHWRRTLTGIGAADVDFRVDVSSDGGDLIIEERRRNGVSMAVGVMRTRYDVLIEAPAGVSLRLEGDDDNYDIRDVNGAIAIASDDGEIRLRSCRGDDFDLKFEDGSLEMDSGRGSLRLRYDDGEADLRNAAFETVRVQANDGTLRLRGDLAREGRYEFSLDDGDAHLRLGDTARGDFTFTMADGSLAIDGGRGSIEVRYDDGDAVLRGGAFERLRVQAGDGALEFDGLVPLGASHVIRLDDGDVRFRARDGGGRISARFDDGNVDAGQSLRVISDSEHGATYEWGDGDASVDIDFNDGQVRLAAP